MESARAESMITGTGRLVAYAAAEADPVHAGHHHVEQRDVRPVGAERLQPREAVGHGGHPEADPLQGELGRLPDHVVVLHEQDMGVVGHRAGPLSLQFSGAAASRGLLRGAVAERWCQAAGPPSLRAGEGVSASACGGSEVTVLL